MSAKGKSTAAFTYTLLPTLRVDDRAWTFHIAGIAGIASSQTGDQANVIKKVSFRKDQKARRHSLALSLQPIQPNRAIQDDPLHCYVLISLEDFRPIRPQDGSTEPTGLQLATFKDCTDYAIRFLRAGLTSQGVTYNFFGHSNSQLKSRSCFLYAGSKEVVSRTVEAMGDFSTMKTVGKKAKRIGLLFSVAQAVINIATDRVQDIPDVEFGDYIFTDGCGLVAPSLAKELARRMRIIFRDRRYTPSVFQIRYRGYKGVVTVDPRMAKEKQPLLKMRKSMKKFNATKNNSFAVVEHSKPYSYGFLNDEHIVLLEVLGITRETLLRKQDEHFQLLASARTDFREAFRFLSYVNESELAEKLLLEGIESVKPQIERLIGAEHAKMINKRDEQRCRIFVAKSRLLFGVADAWGLLKEGECHVKTTLEGNGQAHTLTNTEVSVIRNPCLHPGDWQKFRVVQRPELAHLVDCIVFSTKGKRSPADMMSGGDLDGDTFFVTWDPDLVPATLSRPALYPGGRDPVRFGPITDDDRLVYFAKYSNSSLGQVKRLFMNWARAKGPMSAECQELNRLFSHAVASPDAPPFILDYLHERAVESIKAVYPGTKDWNDLTTDVVELLVAREDIAISEFQLIQLALRWCRTHFMPFQDLLHYFDLNVLTSEERIWLLGELPVTSDTPTLINNALCSSNLLDLDELRYFNLDNSQVRWNCVYDSSRDRLATFLQAITANVETFQRKLIVFRPDERLTLAIYIPNKLERGRDNLVDDSVSLFAFPHSQDREWQSRLVLPTKKTYRLYCDDNILQLFEKQRANSWVFLARPGSDDSAYRNIDNAGDRRRKRQSTVDQKINFDIRASIALDKFSKGLQRHVGRVNRSAITAAEIYIISNRDVSSMQALDLWLEYIATGEKMSLFSQEPKEYAIPRVEDLLPSSASDSIVQLITQQKLETLALLDSVDDYTLVFTLLLELDRRTFLLACFDHLLQNPEVIGADPRPVLHAMVKFLTKAPFLAISFGKPWRGNFSEDVRAVLEVSIIPILRAFILSATSVGGLVVEPLKTTLDNIPDSSLSIEEFVQLTELVSLTARSPEVAMDILLECLEKESGRILSGPSKAIRQTVKSLLGIALDHIGEASKEAKQREELFELKFVSEDDEGCASVDVAFRIDAPGGTPENSCHLRLTVASLPANVHVGRRYSIDGLVIRSQQGSVRVRCLHPLPSYFERCSWGIENCGPFVTTKTTSDALRTLATKRERFCAISGLLLELSAPPLPLDLGLTARQNWHPVEKLNASQNAAIESALESPLVLLWGPPGTGKTETIVEMICSLQEANHDARILVTAPTHNATDNVLRRYCRRLTEQPLRRETQPNPLRVSTDIRKVASDLRSYTCDAMVGQEVHSNFRALKEAKQKIKNCQIIFTNCIGAGLGSLRKERFEIVIVDEASQQTEPASLVPLVKGCVKAIMVGDHSQLRPTVQQLALALDFDVSLFERLYTSPPTPEVRKLMLETQYRMHPSISEFSSREFYKARLKTGVEPRLRPLFASHFPWLAQSPPNNEDFERMIFVECAGKELLGQKSKGNEFQARLCAHLCKLLTTPLATPSQNAASPGPKQNLTSEPQGIVILVPYTRQADMLKSLVSGSPGVEVSSIDGFQGREADIVIFCTVRCNDHGEIGFLTDLRRMNVALTRARAGLIIVGNRATLTGGKADPETTEMWTRLLVGTVPVKIEGPA